MFKGNCHQRSTDSSAFFSHCSCIQPGWCSRLTLWSRNRHNLIYFSNLKKQGMSRLCSIDCLDVSGYSGQKKHLHPFNVTPCKSMQKHAKAACKIYPKSICGIKFVFPRALTKLLEVNWAKRLSEKNQSEAY